MGKISVCVLLTCYNRCDLTIRALDTIDDEGFRIDYLVVDDNSTDGTREAVREWNRRESDEESPLRPDCRRKSSGLLHIIKGSSNLYWAGGIRKGMEFLLNADRHAGKTVEDKEKGTVRRVVPYDYLLLINDDVSFYPGVIRRMIERSKNKGDMPVTGATKGRSTENRQKATTYGGVFYDMKKAKPRQAEISEADKCPVDTFRCYAFLMPWEIFRQTGVFDAHYIQSLADYDYGFMLKRKGYNIWLTDFYVGECDDNEITGSWQDKHLSLRERLKKKESVKGLPREQWYYYLKKNFGSKQAVWHSVTPYLKIVLGV